MFEPVTGGIAFLLLVWNPETAMPMRIIEYQTVEACNDNRPFAAAGGLHAVCLEAGRVAD